LLISALFGARLPAFPTVHGAKIAKLALPGLKQGNFYALFAGKSNGLPSRCRAEAAPVNDIVDNAKNILDTADYRQNNSETEGSSCLV